MPSDSYWADNYLDKRMDLSAAIRIIRSGQRVFIGSGCGEPQYLVNGLAKSASERSGLEIVRLLAMERIPLSLIAKKTATQSLNIRSFYLGSIKPKELADDQRFITPMNLSAIPRLFKQRKLPLHVALIQVSAPDDFGWMSLGVSVDITLAAARSADLVIAQVNGNMPRVHGMSFIHVNDVDVFVERDEELLTIGQLKESESAATIARHIARMVDDGSTIQISLGTTPQATLLALSEKNDLGVHTQYLTNELMHLYSKGVITNRKKGFNEGKMVASSAIGTRELYEFMDDNPAIEFHPSDYVNDPGTIARNNKMVSINLAMAVDLTGQVAADALPSNHFSGVTGMLDFVRGSFMSQGGKSILLLTSTAAHGTRSRIVPDLDDTAVVVPRGDVEYVVTEYGSVNLFGKSLQERALAMISIAHPDFRDELFARAKEKGLLGAERTMKDSLHGVYPLALEETVKIEGQEIKIRPVKPVDERRIQEHFYAMEKEDILSRFFHEKTRFVGQEMEGMSQIDYVRDLTLVALVGEIGFGKVVAVGEYFLDQAKNMAEVAFSVNRDYQLKGLGKILIRKLAQAAQENGIAGLFAYTAPENQGMVRLFKSLPFETRSAFKEDLIYLHCRFADSE